MTPHFALLQADDWACWEVLYVAAMSYEAFWEAWGPGIPGNRLLSPLERPYRDRLPFMFKLPRESCCELSSQIALSWNTMGAEVDCNRNALPLLMSCSHAWTVGVHSLAWGGFSTILHVWNSRGLLYGLSTWTGLGCVTWHVDYLIGRRTLTTPCSRPRR